MNSKALNRIKPTISFIVHCSLFIVHCSLLLGCITEYHPKGLDEIANVLVVEGVITDDETLVILSRSINLTEVVVTDSYIRNARVYVESDDGASFDAENNNDGTYTVFNGKLDTERMYRLKIILGSHVYYSEYSQPILTPEITDVFWTKRGRGQPVLINVSTQSVDNQILYYRWSYREDWEYTADFFWHVPERCQNPVCAAELPADKDNCPQCGATIVKSYPFYCWGRSTNRGFIISSAERTTFGRVIEQIAEIVPADARLAMLYRITVKQNAISKQAYEYFTSVRKYSQDMGSIFSPVISELNGNIICITDRDRPAIGYVEVSTTAQRSLYISQSDDLYEAPDIFKLCTPLTEIEICARLRLSMHCHLWKITDDYILYDYDPHSHQPRYIDVYCVDCTLYGGVTEKPDDWKK